MSGNAIEIRGVSKQFRVQRHAGSTMREHILRGPRPPSDEFWVLRDINLSVEAGTSFAIVGHNGSGKSTLLKLIAGIHRPSTGTITTHGRVSALLELGAGFHPDLSGRDNVFLNGAILGIGRRKLESTMEAIVDFAGLDDFIDSPVKFYSSGMVARLAFAIAVNVEPEILLVDEIIAVGDEEFQRKCMENLYRLRRSGTTIVLVSHSLPTVRDLCDHGLWLDHGHQMEVGPINEVTDAYLSDVNAKEAAASGQKAPGDIEPGRVLGSGEMTLTSVEFIRDDGVAESALCDRPLTIRFHYRAADDIPAADFALSFHHESGVVIAQARVGGPDEVIQIKAGTGHIDFSTDHILLQPGIYDLSTTITHRGHVIDMRDRLFPFPVRSTGREVAGFFRQTGRWQVSADPA